MYNITRYMVPTIREISNHRGPQVREVSSLWVGVIWERFMGVHLKLGCEKWWWGGGVLNV